jgi:FMN phosphatase YigB (HAD superfamily)
MDIAPVIAMVRPERSRSTGKAFTNDGETFSVTTRPLFTIDLGGTFGHVVGDGADPAEILARLAPRGYNRQTLDFHVKRILNTAAVTDDVIRQLCDVLLINEDQWPDPWPGVTFEFFEAAWTVLRELSDLGTVVALTNQNATTKPAMDYIMNRCGQYVKTLYASYDLGDVKPARWLWKSVAESEGYKVGDIVHIGDRYTQDVRGPLSAGARGAVWVHGGSTVFADLDDRTACVTTLAEVPGAVRRLLGEVDTGHTFTGGGV